MKVVVLNQYSKDPNEALKVVKWPIPTPTDEEVLVNVRAASLNPIDARMRTGYGRTLFAAKAPLPIVLGRDFSGTILKIGPAVQGYAVGDEVFGVMNPFRCEGLKQGTHREYLTVPIIEITKKPKNMDHVQTASLPYVALTTYSALITQARMQCTDYKSLRVLVHAGAGGVGSYAIQFLKTLGAHVITTCSTKNIGFVQDLGADEVIDYSQEDYSKRLKECDIAYDLLGNTHTSRTLDTLVARPPSSHTLRMIEKLYEQCMAKLNSATEEWSVPNYKAILNEFDTQLFELLDNMPKYISIVSPMMSLTDDCGLQEGMKKFVATTLQQKMFQAKTHGRFFNYSFFEPNQEGLRLLADDLARGKIKPIVGQVFSLEDAASAHAAIETERTQGKIVFNMKTSINDV